MVQAIKQQQHHQNVQNDRSQWNVPQQDSYFSIGAGGRGVGSKKLEKSLKIESRTVAAVIPLV